MDQELLTNMLMVVLMTFGPVMVAYIANLVHQANERAKKEHWYALVSEFAHTAVAAAEQLGLSGQLEELASDKFEYAMGQLETMLLANGIKLDVDVPLAYLKTIIEAEVGRLPKMLPATVLHTD